MISRKMTLKALFVGLVGCGSDAEPLLLEVDPSIETVQTWPDKSALAAQRGTWDSFKTSDSLNDQLDIQVEPPNMMLVSQRDRFAEKPLYYIDTTDGFYFGSVG